LYVGGWLTDKIGYKQVQMWSLILAGASFIATMYVRDFWAMCAMTFLFAFFGDAFRPANQVAIRMNSDEATRTRAFSLMRIAVNLAISVALVGGGLLVRLGWEWLFWVDGLTCFAAALLLYFFVNEKNTTPQYISDLGRQISENEVLESERQAILIKDKKVMDNAQLPTLSAYHDRDYLLFVFLTFIGATVFMQIMWTVPVFFKEIYHWNEAQIGLANALNAVLIMVIEMPLIFRIENKKNAMWFVRLGIVLYGLAYIAFFLPPSWAISAVVIYMVMISFGEIFVMPFSTSWATKRSGTARQGQYMGLYGMAYSVSNVFAPFVGTQVIATFGYSALWSLMLGLSGVAFAGFWYLEQKNS
jgi:MFS family permease